MSSTIANDLGEGWEDHFSFNATKIINGKHVLIGMEAGGGYSAWIDDKYFKTYCNLKNLVIDVEKEIKEIE